MQQQQQQQCNSGIGSIPDSVTPSSSSTTKTPRIKNLYSSSSLSSFNEPLVDDDDVVGSSCNDESRNNQQQKHKDSGSFDFGKENSNGFTYSEVQGILTRWSTGVVAATRTNFQRLYYSMDPEVQAACYTIYKSIFVVPYSSEHHNSNSSSKNTNATSTIPSLQRRRHNSVRLIRFVCLLLIVVVLFYVASTVVLIIKYCLFGSSNSNTQQQQQWIQRNIKHRRRVAATTGIVGTSSSSSSGILSEEEEEETVENTMNTDDEYFTSRSSSNAATLPMASCVYMGVNHTTDQLIEWIAYHYEMLPMRYMTLGISTSVPTFIQQGLDAYRYQATTNRSAYNETVFDDDVMFQYEQHQEYAQAYMDHRYEAIKNILKRYATMEQSTDDAGAADAVYSILWKPESYIADTTSTGAADNNDEDSIRFQIELFYSECIEQYQQQQQQKNNSTTEFQYVTATDVDEFIVLPKQSSSTSSSSQQQQATTVQETIQQRQNDVASEVSITDYVSSSLGFSSTADDGVDIPCYISDIPTIDFTEIFNPERPTFRNIAPVLHKLIPRRFQTQQYYYVRSNNDTTTSSSGFSTMLSTAGSKEHQVEEEQIRSEPSAKSLRILDVKNIDSVIDYSSSNTNIHDTIECRSSSMSAVANDVTDTAAQQQQQEQQVQQQQWIHIHRYPQLQSYISLDETTELVRPSTTTMIARDDGDDSANNGLVQAVVSLNTNAMYWLQQYIDHIGIGAAMHQLQPIPTLPILKKKKKRSKKKKKLYS